MDKTVTKAKFVQRLADKMNASKKDAQDWLDVIFDEIVAVMKEGDKVNITGFGIFRIYDRKARMGRNPATGEPVQIAAKRMPKFRPGKVLKEAIE
ncbi:MAG: hypothetical protein COV31_01210 [Candidatus Yanofskybacteria bacterium CG10_big_fil_rev_8_21_14_0_10_46_23]|uniref:DNA-binding protein n=1 Tax=Candidatus Yanofskybacteria bacterium CG10_big_fil_rev_8_21_14_0_10_46_23 TaxID=1975098 RepID=A0A2H0R570_9BACT|nr:MAG: hypothetical protein COV31_01210 [Candidatus Yanofskybacteria bacterium CG10_big_fil_rev_8_21_14_0_10_46_23]